MTTAEVLELARRFTGQPLSTGTGARFSVEVDGNCPWFTPASTGIPRSDGTGALARFVERFNKTGSLRPVDYHDVTRNSSYYVALIRAGGYRGRG